MRMGPRRRDPVSRDRYRAIARDAGVRAQLARPRWIDAPLDPSGAFAATLALKDGANTVGVALVADRDVVAASTYTVVLDRTPPTLTVAQPAAGSTVDAKNIIVSGTTEVGSTITVNGHTVVTAPDGGFTDSFSATQDSVR